MMKTVIFYDTETNGLINWTDPSDHPDQPHIVQLAALLVDLDSKKTLSTIDVIIRPEGWTISPDLTEIHGISHELAMDVGISEKTASEMLIDMIGNRTRIGHNESFDARIIRIALKRYQGDEAADKWKEGNAECTARMTTKEINLPPTDKMKAAGRNTPKTPSMSEAYRHYFGIDLVDAHSALADAAACRDVYFKIAA